VLSDHTKHNLEQAFHRALQTSLSRAPEDVCSIERADGRNLGEPASENVLVITISSFAFRLLALFHLATNPATRSYYVGGAPGKSLDEAFGEVANRCCGALSRELAQQFPHLAMSIPYLLSRHCLAFVAELQPQYLTTCEIRINDAVRLQASLCVCCSAQVDFAATQVGVEHSGGELEMF
jgi:hypothetical protein